MKSYLAPSITAYSLFFAPIPVRAADTSNPVRFSSQEASIMQQYYRDNPASDSSDKKGRKSFARGKPLPPGIARQTLPGALLSQLPPSGGGYERVIIDGWILLVEIATQVVHDVLADATDG